MQFKPNNNLLHLRPDSTDVILKEYNLDKPGAMEESIKILREWVKKQPHFTRTDFTDGYLRSTILEGKGSIEKAKQFIDRMCTLRTLLPQCFGVIDVRNDFKNVFEVTTPVILPNLTKEHYRVFISKLNTNVTDSAQIANYFRYGYLIGDYIKAHDIVTGYRLIVDFTDINMMDLLTKLNPMDLRHALTIYLEGYGMKIKGIHLITASKFIDGLIVLLKQILKPKVGGRIYVHKTCEDLHEIIGKDILPEEFGGYEKSLKAIHEDWLEELSREELKKYLRDINSAKTDEACRPSVKFNEDYAGMPGTFRVLSLD
ncbi:clavesin-1-like [Zerene cesonia]|uniref:clavesin-1-like n=1 Tax=Zerene cesonia TaxID=33412 RepID=UPI0018E5211B|nr:clavesin-1-like [Zerene cesonia]